MPQFSANPTRFDPYRGFKFHIIFDGPDPVAGLSKCGALKKSTEVVEFRVGGDESHSRKMPGQTKYEPITLEQGLTHDATFEDWANLVNNYTSDGDMSLKNFRKDISIIVNNLQGVPVYKYIVHRCWVSEYQALAELDAGGNAVLIRTLTLQNEGWERDLSVTEPTET